MDPFFEIHFKDFNLTTLKSAVSEIEQKWYRDRRLKYFNLSSVKNFIYHFNGLPHEGSLRQKIYDALSNYLKLVDTVDLNEFSLLDADTIYQSYLFPIGIVYMDNLEFSLDAALAPMIYLLITCILILFLIRPPLVYSIIIVSAFVLKYGYGLYKRKQKKAFGLFY